MAWPMEITQIVEVVKGVTDEYDVCFIGYVVANRGMEPLDVNVAVAIDTCIDTKDDNFFAYPSPADTSPKRKETLLSQPLEFSAPQIPPLQSHFLR